MPRTGRPRKQIDLKQVETFGSLGLTGEEMAALLKVDGATISHRMNEPGSEFRKAYESGLSNLKMSLRRKQIAVALRGKGNGGMLIWLGKQILGQVEAPTTVVDVIQNAGIPTRTPEQIKAELVELQKAVLEEARRFGDN